MLSGIIHLRLNVGIALSTSFSSFKVNTRSMATSPSTAVLRDVCVGGYSAVSSRAGGLRNLPKPPASAYFKDGAHRGCLRAARVDPIRPQPLSGNWSFRNSSLLHGPWKKNLSSSFSARCLAGTAHGVSTDESPPDKQIQNSSTLPNITAVGRKNLKMVSGSCYLPHPDKEETGGEDAHFICADEQAVGVADGVGGWADVGVNAGLFAQELISNLVVAVKEEPEGSFNPARVLEKAHSNMNAMGSSTACIIALTDKGLRAINLGDSGFIVIRDGRTIFKSPVQQHGFNCPYQLESSNRSDLPSSGDVFTLPVSPGDVIVAGTDGLFDNLHDNEIHEVVEHAVKSGLEPHITAQKIAALARQRSLDPNWQSPFSTAAQQVGFRYLGGKVDDTTVVVSYIST